MPMLKPNDRRFKSPKDLSGTFSAHICTACGRCQGSFFKHRNFFLPRRPDHHKLAEGRTAIQTSQQPACCVRVAPLGSLMRIANLVVDTEVLLAPMAAVTDLPFRTICEEHGVV